MINKLKIFNNKEFGEIRTIVINGEPMFVGKDVASALGYKDTAKAIRVHVDEEDKGVDEMDTPGGKQNITVINESGLYSLILSSHLPSAKKFKHWITSEVIPSIRKNGLYAVDELLDNPDLFIDVLQELKLERENNKNLKLQIAQNNQIIGELKPKASYYDLILQNKSLMPITKIAKDYGMSGRAFNAMLHELGIQYKLGNTWLLYQHYADNGYTQLKTHAIDADKSVMHTYWTQKGRLFLYDLLKNEKGLLPLIERNQCA